MERRAWTGSAFYRSIRHPEQAGQGPALSKDQFSLSFRLSS
jgi:hypothetical protein